MTEKDLDETERQLVRMLRRSRVEAAQQKDVRMVTVFTDGLVDRLAFAVAKPPPMPTPAPCDLVSNPL